MIRLRLRRCLSGWSLGVALLLSAGLLACGGVGKPPKRGVIERDVDSWGFRRYQSVLDVEVWVAKNRGEGHTASYVRKSSEKQGRIDEGDVVNAFVTRYEQDEGVARALVTFARRMAQQSGYEVEENRMAGVRLIEVKGPTEFWVFWPAKKHVIKIGGRGLRSVPESLVKAYAERYPSKLTARALEGPLPEGPAEPEVEQEAFDPGNPAPEWK